MVKRFRFQYILAPSLCLLTIPLVLVSFLCFLSSSEVLRVYSSVRFIWCSVSACTCYSRICCLSRLCSLYCICLGSNTLLPSTSLLSLCPSCVLIVVELFLLYRAWYLLPTQYQYPCTRTYLVSEKVLNDTLTRYQNIQLIAVVWPKLHGEQPPTIKDSYDYKG